MIDVIKYEKEGYCYEKSNEFCSGDFALRWHFCWLFQERFCHCAGRPQHYCRKCISNELVFLLEMLPAGKSVTAVEVNKQASTEAEIHYVDGTVSYIDAGLENRDCVEVTGDGPIQVHNTTDEALPLVRVFYRKTDGNGNLIGGPCYSFMVDGIEAGGTVEAEAEFWDMSCEVVTVLVINE